MAELAGFWLLTLFQLPLTVYLLANIDTIILPLERAVRFWVGEDVGCDVKGKIVLFQTLYLTEE